MVNSHVCDLLPSRISTKINRTKTCWLWTGGTNKPGEEGYGIARGPDGKRRWRVHRLVWTVANGPIPSDAKVLHSCDVRRCCNPKHLFLGTTQDNSDDMVSKGRSTAGERNPSAKLTEAQVLDMRAAHASGRATHRELAKRFGVSKSLVAKIIQRRRWAATR